MNILNGTLSINKFMVERIKDSFSLKSGLLRSTGCPTVTVYAVVSHKASGTLRPLLIYCASPSEWLSFLIHPPQLSGSNQQTPSSEKVRNSARISMNFSFKYLFHTVGIFNIPWNLTWDRRLSPLPKEVVLRIFIALQNQPSSAGFEPANLGSNGKHDNHLTTENYRLS
jgi:hypothetical protein